MARRKKAGLAIEMIAVTKLTPDPHNARLHSERNVAAVVDSLQKFGQRQVLVVQRRGEELVVRAGNARLAAAKRLGWQEVACVVIDESDTLAQAFAIADNQTGALAEWDWKSLADQLKDLQAASVDLSTLGFSAAELDPLLNADWKTPGQLPLPDREQEVHHLQIPIDRWPTIHAAIERCQGHAKEELSQSAALAKICEEWLKE